MTLGDLVPKLKPFKIININMVLCCNHLPKLPPDDEGIWRHISVIEFRSRFVDEPNPNKSNEFKKDVHLSDKINNWIEPFMYILLEHYKIYQTKGLIEPKEVKNATQQYKRDVDDIGAFIDEHIESSDDPGIFTTVAQIWDLL
jgi:putative DNA primase/helicase